MSPTYTISKSKFFSKLKRLDFYNIFLEFVLILLVLATILLIIRPDKYISSINAGIQLFFYSVFPSLFPFLFISKLIDGLGGFSRVNKLLKPITVKLYRCPEVSCYPFLMTLVSGYPIGAKIVGDLYSSGQIDDHGAKKIIALASTSGPIFVIGSVGANMLKNTFLGTLIFICHIAGCLVTAFFFTRSKNKGVGRTSASKTQETTNLLGSATSGTIMSILSVAVYISIFYMFIDMAYDLKILTFGAKFFEGILSLFGLDPRLGFGISSGIVEMTRGCKEIASLNNDFASLVFCSGLISFGGLSIILQSLTFLGGTKVKPLYFILLKVVQSIITMLIATAVGLIFL